MYSMVKPVCAAQVEVSEGGIVSLNYDEQDNDWLSLARQNCHLVPDDYAKGYRVHVSGCSGRQFVVARDRDWIICDGMRNLHVFSDADFKALFAATEK